MEKIVLDASVIVKWYVNEIWMDESLILRDRYLDGHIKSHLKTRLIAADEGLIRKTLDSGNYIVVHVRDAI